MDSTKKKGRVILVGAGPGDPSLITLKGVEHIKKADVIVYDYLVSNAVIDYAPEGVELIYVGKKSGDHTFSQNQINAILVSKANEKKRVVRLKGGDPFIFGRGGEEVEALFDSKIDFEIVPGITSAIAASTYSGIPLTHRDYASDLTFITGHENPSKSESNINWETISKLNGTLVFFMGVRNLKSIIQKLIMNGKDKKTPIAIIRWGTLTKQTIVVGTLEGILIGRDLEKVKPPSIIVVGHVVSLREKIKWFDKCVLKGKSIIVTRARSQSSSLVNRLSNLGANCIELPIIKIVPKKNLEDLSNFFRRIREYSWIIFTSVNSVKIFFKHVFSLKKDSRIFFGVKIVAIGSATKEELVNFGIVADLIPNKYCAESIVDSFRKFDLAGNKICLPRAYKARNIIPFELEKMGAIVDVIPIYKTVRANIKIENIIKKLKNNEINMITFTSSSTVENFKKAFSSYDLSALLKNVNIAAIGPITAKTASKLGFNVDVIALKYTMKGLCNSIVKYYSYKSI